MTNGNYLGQEEEFIEDTTPLEVLHKQWQTIDWHEDGQNRFKNIPEGLVRGLINAAQKGSWLAGNMLHLSQVRWSEVVGDEQYEYGLATYHKSNTAKIMLVTNNWVSDQIKLMDIPVEVHTDNHDIPVGLLAETGRPDINES